MFILNLSPSIDMPSHEIGNAYRSRSEDVSEEVLDYVDQAEAREERLEFQLFGRWRQVN